MQEPSRHQTRAALVRSAQRLIAERGMGAVSIKAITREAGARNPSAVYYHFGNIEELIKEVFGQRYTAIEVERMKRFAAVKPSEQKDRLQAVMEAALAPLLESCQDEEGRLFVRFCLQFVSDPRFDTSELVDEISMISLATFTDKLIECLPHLSRDVFDARLRRGFLISIIIADDYCDQIERDNAPPIDAVIREATLSLSAFFAAPAS